ncbi:hypothetical protein F511_15512 [Dorcoceras hygrometricum]|uniref:Uncharacterized protein n=1 Tax=Dorcoceras hygrometricum TaxID=472368 RepID=A0A2Z7A809_9LAMI|nr:hypothetical protein F511_15512 [Dorcoceras hygrometricum]
MSLFDLQDVCIAIRSLTTLDLPMVVDLIGIYGLKGPYCTLTTTNWFLQALSVIPRGSWGDVARRFTMIRWASLLVQADEVTLLPVVDLIRRNLPPSTVKSQSPCDFGWSQAPVASKIALDKQSCMIRHLRVKLATERRESAATKEGLETKVSSLERDLQIQRCDNHSLRNTMNLCHADIDRRISQLVEAKKEHRTNQVALEDSHKTIAGLTEIGLCMSKKIERMKAKKQQARESHMECHHKLQARIQEAEDTIQEQHLIIEALVEEKASLLQTFQGMQEDHGAPAPFDDEWEEESKEDPEEEGLDDIPIGEGEIVDE